MKLKADSGEVKIRVSTDGTMRHAQATHGPMYAPETRQMTTCCSLQSKRMHQNIKQKEIFVLRVEVKLTQHNWFVKKFPAQHKMSISNDQFQEERICTIIDSKEYKFSKTMRSTKQMIVNSTHLQADAAEKLIGDFFFFLWFIVFYHRHIIH